MGYFAELNKITRALERILTSDVRLGSISKVYKAERFYAASMDFPALFICSGRDDISELAVPNTQEHKIPFEIAVAVENSEMEEGRRQVLELAGHVFDILKESPSRDLEGACEWYDLAAVDPVTLVDEQSGSITHWAAVEILVHFIS